MDRLLVLRLETAGCTAEASLNGVPLARAGGARPAVVSIPVHEYTVQGANELELSIEPAPPGISAEPEPRLTDGHTRLGHVPHPHGRIPGETGRQKPNRCLGIWG